MAKTKMKVVVSPEATAAYAWLSRPDEGQEYSDGKYKVTLVLNKGDKDVEAFITSIIADAKSALEQEFGKIPKGARMPFKDGDEGDKEEFEGKYLIVAKTKFQPGFVDAHKTPLDDDVYPMSGDVIRASFALIPYKAGGAIGVTSQLRNVMLIDKRNNGSGFDDFSEVVDDTPKSKEEINDDEDFDI
jgi:hypothetical protein